MRGRIGRGRPAGQGASRGRTALVAPAGRVEVRCAGYGGLGKSRLSAARCEYVPTTSRPPSEVPPTWRDVASCPDIARGISRRGGRPWIPNRCPGGRSTLRRRRPLRRAAHRSSRHRPPPVERDAGVLGAAALVGVAAFALAFGSGAAGSVGLAGGAQLSAIAGVGSDALGNAGSGASEPVVVVEIVGAVSTPACTAFPGLAVGDLVTRPAASGHASTGPRGRGRSIGPRVLPTATGSGSRRATIRDDRRPRADQRSTDGSAGQPARPQHGDATPNSRRCPGSDR